MGLGGESAVWQPKYERDLNMWSWCMQGQDKEKTKREAAEKEEKSRKVRCSVQCLGG